MSSVNTNIAANVALQTLTQTQKSMVRAQARISTGYRVQEAQDNAAYWSIGTTMRSDATAMSAVKDALALGSATADVAFAAMSTSVKLVDQLKQKVVAAREPGLDRDKIQKDIAKLQVQLQHTIDSASFSGQNWLKIDTTSGATIQKSIVASYARSDSIAAANTGMVGTIQMTLYDAGTGATVAMLDANSTASAKVGLLDRQLTTTSGSQYNILTLDIRNLTDSPADLADLDSIVTGVDQTMAAITSAATAFGGLKSRADMQRTFVSTLMETLDRGVSHLVDADMNDESTKLQAMHTKQSLGLQSLSIANQTSKVILQLFQ